VIAVLDRNASLSLKADIVRFLEQEGFRVQVSETPEGPLVSVICQGAEAIADALRGMPGVTELRPEAPGYPLVSRAHKPDPTRVKVEEIVIGGRELVVMAGPCAVESREQILAAADAVRRCGALLLRGGAFKPRSSPYSFQGLGARGLELLAEARERTGLRVVTEVVAPEDVELVAAHADMLQIGARNMHNYRLLSAAGRQPKPVLLKRGMMSTVDELLLSAEYVVAAGNPRVVLCERGIRTFENSSRNTLDLCAVPILKERTHLPVLVDPSHAAGRREWVPSLALAAVAAGADGLIVEVHPDPRSALSDGRQSLTPEAFQDLMHRLRRLAPTLDRGLRPPEA